MEVIQNIKFSADDFLNIVCVLPGPGTQYNITVMVEGNDGIEFLSNVWNPLSIAGNTFRFCLNGYKLLGVSVLLLAGATYQYLPEVSIFISRGFTPGGVANLNLINGFPDTVRGLSWPSYEHSNIWDDLESVTVVAPIVGPGVNVFIAVPAGQAWKPVKVSFSIATSLVVANRYAVFRGFWGVANIAIYGCNTNAIIANSNINCAFFPDGQNNLFFDNQAVSMFSSGWLPAGNNFELGLINIDGGDQVANVIAEFKRKLI